MHCSIPAFDSTTCPKCGAANTDKKFHVWKVADERGLHFECSVCATAFPYAEETLNAPRAWPA